MLKKIIAIILLVIISIIIGGFVFEKFWDWLIALTFLQNIIAIIDSMGIFTLIEKILRFIYFLAIGWLIKSFI